MNTLSERIQELREKKGLRKNELAEIIGVHPSSIGRIEENSIPKADILFALAQFFNVSMEWLLTGKEIKSQDKNYDNQDILPEYDELYEIYNELPAKDKIDVFTYIKVRYSIVKEREMREELSSTFENGNYDTGENNIA